MNLIWHMLKKDARRSGGLVVLWVLVLATRLYVGIQASVSGDYDPAWSIELKTYYEGLSLLELLFIYGLSGWLILEDAVVGTSPHWLTRPIGRGRMLLIKLLGLVWMLWLPPLLLALPWWHACGYGLRETLWAMRTVVGLQVVVTLFAALFATMTRNWTQFIVTSLGFFIAINGIALWLSSYPVLRWALLPSQFGISPAAGAIAVVLTGLIMQYLTRNVRRTALWTMLMGSALICALVLSAWQKNSELNWSYFGAQGIWPPRSEVGLAPIAPGVPGVEVKVGNTKLKKYRGNFLQFTEVPWGPKMKTPGFFSSLTSLEFRGIAESGFMCHGVIEQELSWSDGIKLRRTGGFGMNRENGEDNKKAAALAVLNLTGTGEKKGVITGDSRISIPGSFADKMEQQPVTLTGKYYLEFCRGSVEMDLPLRIGSEVENKSMRFKLTGLERVGNAVRITCVVTHPARWTNPLLVGFNSIYTIVNREQQRVYFLGPPGNLGSGLTVATVSVGRIRFEVPVAEDDGLSAQIPAWFKRANLVRIDFRPSKTYSGQLPPTQIKLQETAQVN